MVQDKAIASEEAVAQEKCSLISSVAAVHLEIHRREGAVSSLWHTRVVLGDL